MGCSGRQVTAVAQVLLECADELIRNEMDYKQKANNGALIIEGW